MLLKRAYSQIKKISTKENLVMSPERQSEIYNQFHDKVLWFILEKVGDKYLAEDICSDVFVKIIAKYESFDANKSSISTWVFTIARNTLIDYYRGRKVYEEVPEDMSVEFDIDENICNEETIEELAVALKKLEERERDIVILRYYSGITLKEIAQKLNISYAYVKILHNKAIGNLKSYMNL